MLLFFLTLLVLASWYLFVSGAVGGSLSSRLVLAGTGASGQIVITCMVIGLAGYLTAALVTVTSVAISAVLVGSAFRLGGARRPSLRMLAADARALWASARAALGWETVILTLLLLFAALWIAMAVIWFPPRGIDDLVYHLPPVYQAVQDGKFQILPLALRKFFAFPFSAEMPFLWVVLLTRSARWVDGTQAVFAVLGMIAVYALGRRYDLSPRGAFLASGLFGLMPVVLLQATSNYVDLITNTWVLAAAVALLRYGEGGSRTALALAGLATGLVAGSKYQALLFALALAGIAAFLVRGRERSIRKRAFAAALFGLPALAAGSYWYIRNWILFSNPFYPLPVRLFGETVFPGDWPQGPSILSKLLAEPAEIFRIAAWDPGLGSFNGGFGFLLWGFAVPALVRLAVEVRREGAGPPPGRLLVLGLVPVGILSLLLSPLADVAFTPRYVLSIGGFVFIAVAHLAQEAAGRKLGAAFGLRAAAVLAGFLAFLAAAPSNRPPLDLALVTDDAPGARALSELRYLKHSGWDLAPMSGIWAPLDAMTRQGAGLTVYQASDYAVFWTAPTYGTELQNRIWNFEKEEGQAREPDAFFFHILRGTALYLGKEIHRETVAADPRYRLVASERGDATTLYVSRAALAERDREKRLADFYRPQSAVLIEQTRSGAAMMEPNSLVLVPFPLAAAYLVHKADGLLRAQIEPITTKETALVAERFPGRVIYTAGGALPGMRTRRVHAFEGSDGKEISIVRNEPPDPAPGGMGARP